MNKFEFDKVVYVIYYGIYIMVSLVVIYLKPKNNIKMCTYEFINE